MNGIIALIHGGKTFVDQIAAACNSLNLELYILSSEVAEQSLVNNMASKSTNLFVTTNKDLTETCINNFINTLRSEGKSILGCVSVWENYRPLMAATNKKLSRPDISVEQVQHLRDKYALRKSLINNQLSNISTDILNESLLNQFKKNRIEKFIKPRQGIASFGAFKLNDSTQWQQIEEITSQIQQDKLFSSSFNRTIDFIAEDYIPGVEYCFEIFVYLGVLYIVAIHEKVEVEENNSTTLENVSISPSITLNSNDINAADRWLQDVFQSLELTNGCYHVEAKHHHDTWEIVEVNPRVGGSYINDSVEYTTGYSLLYLWITLLTAEENKQSSAALLLNSISSRDTSFLNRENGAYFRAFFAEPNQLIQTIDFNHKNQPILSKVLISPGHTTPNANRELFIAQALWPWDVKGNKDSIMDEIRESKQALEVTYG